MLCEDLKFSTCSAATEEGVEFMACRGHIEKKGKLYLDICKNNPENIIEKSQNFVIEKKWEPCCDSTWTNFSVTRVQHVIQSNVCNIDSV